MDPITCWHRLLDAIASGDPGEARDSAEDLAMWVGRGGFLPRDLVDTIEFARALREGR